MTEWARDLIIIRDVNFYFIGKQIFAGTTKANLNRHFLIPCLMSKEIETTVENYPAMHQQNRL